MKSFLSLPQDGAFFTRYATLGRVLSAFTIPAQIVSAITEAAILFSLALANFRDIFPELAPYAAGAVALVGTALLEFGIRNFLPYAVRAILHRRFAGLDLVMSVFIIASSAALLLASGVLSFTGSKAIVEAVAAAPELETTAAADSLYLSAERAAVAAYRADSTAIAGRYAPQIDAARASAAAAVSEQRAALRGLEARERATGQSFRTQKAAIRERMAAAEAAGAAKIAELTGRQGEELSAAHARRVAALEAAGADHATARGKITSANDEAEAEAAAKVHRHGNLLGWLTVVCLLIVVSSVTLKEVHHKGAGIELQVQPSEYDFRPSWLTEGVAAINSRFQFWVRTRIAEFDAKTPEPPLPITPGALYELDNFDARRIRIRLADPEKEAREITLPRRRIGFRQSWESAPPVPDPLPDPVHKPDVPFTAHEISAGEDHEHGAGDHNLADLKQRLKMYKKRLGKHEQIRKAAERKGKEVPARTLAAIDNNAGWVRHYEILIQELLKK